MIPIDLSGRVAVVTGGSGELGRVMCRTLASAGAKVAVHYHRGVDRAQQVVESIRGTGGVAAAFPADITDLQEVLALAEEVDRHLGAATIVVTNAVAQYAWTSVLEQGIEDFESQFRSCVLQNVNVAKAFVPRMIEANWGRIVAINTECAMQNFPGQSAYVSGKRGMDGVLRVLAKEVGRHGITVNQVAPGWTVTDKLRGREDDPQAEYVRALPLGRAGTDQEIANAVVFLVSDLASYVTGTYLPVCGGNVMPAI